MNKTTKNLNKIGFFEERPGVRSVGRLLSFIVVLNALILLNIELVVHLMDNEFEIHTYFVLELAGLGITGKVIQKFFEKRNERNNSPYDPSADSYSNDMDDNGLDIPEGS